MTKQIAELLFKASLLDKDDLETLIVCLIKLHDEELKILCLKKQ